MRFSINLTLQQRIGLLVIVGLAIGLGLFSWLGVQSLNESTERTLEERLTLARIVASQLDETLRHVMAHLQSAANLSAELPTEEEFTPMAQSLRDVLAKSETVVQYIILLDEDGKVLRTEPEASGIIGFSMFGYPEVIEAMETRLPTVSGLISMPLTEVPTVLATAPIINAQGRTIGALSVTIDINGSSISAVGEPIILGNTGYTEIVDSNGIVLARTEPGRVPEAFERSDHPGRFAELISEGKATVRTCHRCHGPEDQPERQRDVLAFAPLTTGSWGVVIRQSEEEALAPTRQLQSRLLILGAIVLVGTLLLTWVVTQGVVRPVKMLTAASKRVAAGDFTAIIPIKRRDEIGQLSSAFSAMTQELARSREELVLRTEDLSALNSLATTVSQSLNLEEVLANALQKVLEVTKSKAGCVFLLGSADDKLETMNRIGPPGIFNCKESSSSSANCACHQALRWGQAQLVNDVSQCPMLGEDAAIKDNISRFVSVPLKSTRGVLGIMNIAFPSERDLTESDFRLLDSIGYHVGLAIDNSVLYEEARQNEELRGQLLNDVISAQEDERKRIARELHDEYGQTLTGLIWSIEAVENMASPKQWRLKEKLISVKSTASHALEVMRRLALDLRPPALDDLGLTVAIRSYAQTHLEAVGTHVDVETEGLSERLAPSVEITIFRIVQEAVHNIARHAEARNAKVQLKVQDGKVIAVVEDDGKGFNVAAFFRPGSRARSLGLLGIRERVALLRGSFDIKSNPGEGTRLTVEIPIDSSQGGVPSEDSETGDVELKPGRVQKRR